MCWWYSSQPGALSILDPGCVGGGGGGGGGGAPGGVGPIMYHSLILVSNLSNFELKITAGAEE